MPEAPASCSMPSNPWRLAKRSLCDVFPQKAGICLNSAWEKFELLDLLQQMTYVKQLEDYEEAVMAKRLQVGAACLAKGSNARLPHLVDY